MNTDKLVTDNIGYVVTMAKLYAGRGVAMDDLISEGNMAMVDASRKYDPAKGKRCELCRSLYPSCHGAGHRGAGRSLQDTTVGVEPRDEETEDAGVCG